MKTGRARGDEAEQRAARVLERAGLVIEARNYRAGPVELDLVARDGDTLCFVEVRARRSARFGSAAASVTREKRARLMRAAAAYLAARPGPAPRCRFDVVTLDGPAGDEQLRWHRAAFRAEGV